MEVVGGDGDLTLAQKEDVLLALEDIMRWAMGEYNVDTIVERVSHYCACDLHKQPELMQLVVERYHAIVLRGAMEDPPVELLKDKLFIGSYRTASSDQLLSEYKIKYVVNAAKQCRDLFPDKFVYQHVPIDDFEDQDIKQHFESTLSFIKNAQGRVLVHCVAGISRSSAICIAYLMESESWPLKQALDHVKQCRDIIQPNDGFMLQLIAFEEQLFGRTSMDKKQFSYNSGMFAL